MDAPMASADGSAFPSVPPSFHIPHPDSHTSTVDGAFLVGFWLVRVRARIPPPGEKKTLHKGRERHCVDVLQGFFWTVTSLYGKISQNECHEKNSFLADFPRNYFSFKQDSSEKFLGDFSRTVFNYAPPPLNTSASSSPIT